MPGHEVLYLSRADVEAVELSMAAVIDAVALALAEKARGRAEMPPKHWLQPSEHRFFSAMTSVVPAVASAACKWQSGSSENTARGLPYLTGLLILNELDTGLPVAIMDSTWLTAQRTAAASAVAARHLANPYPRTVAILGCGVQGRANLVALRTIFPGLEEVRAYDIVPEHLAAYATEVERRHGLCVRACGRPRDAMQGAHIVVTAGPIEPKAPRTIEPGWLEPGGLGIALDYDCYWQPAALRAADRFYTDDAPQLLHLREYGYFLDAPPVTAELGEVVAGLTPGRKREGERIVTMNMGVAVEDVVTARRIYEAARAQGRGRPVPL